MNQEGTISDHEFVVQLRVAIERYLCAVDQWEAAYQQCYHLAGYSAGISEALEEALHEYSECRRELEAMLPRTQRLCLRYGMSDVFSGLLRISLGECAPQQHQDSAIGRNERGAVSRRLMELHAACRERECGVPPERIRGSLVQWLVSYFS